MTYMLQRYKYHIIAVLCLLVIATATWALTTRTKTNKIPSRGVFVMQSVPDYNQGEVYA